jgi:DNA-binding NarL/FixJ family response regulator
MSSENGTGILLASIDNLVRLGFCQAVVRLPEFRIDAEALEPEQLDIEISRHPRALLVIDSSFKREGNDDFVIHLKNKNPELRILLLCREADSSLALRAIDQGASCYLMTSTLGILVAALQGVFAGLQYIDPNLLKLKTTISAGTSSRPLHEALSEREAIVFRCIVRGKSIKEIAIELNLSVKTVSTYKSRILKKMHMRSTADLVSYALRKNMLH